MATARSSETRTVPTTRHDASATGHQGSHGAGSELDLTAGGGTEPEPAVWVLVAVGGDQRAGGCDVVDGGWSCRWAGAWSGSSCAVIGVVDDLGAS